MLANGDIDTTGVPKPSATVPKPSKTPQNTPNPPKHSVGSLWGGLGWVWELFGGLLMGVGVFWDPWMLTHGDDHTAAVGSIERRQLARDFEKDER